MSNGNVIILPLSAITIGERARKDLGDIAALADSIRELGLLQTIGVDPDRRLIFGHRRLEAVRHLGMDSIQARIIEVPSLIRAEHAENEVRKDFTHSERVAIGKAIEEEIGNRQGQRTDKTSDELVQNFAQVESGQKTRQLAAEKAGFGNHETYRQAKTVIAQAVPELIDAMDREDIAVSTAAKLAKASPEVQRQAAAHPQNAPLLARCAPKNTEGDALKAKRAAMAAELATALDKLEETENGIRERRADNRRADREDPFWRSKKFSGTLGTDLKEIAKRLEHMTIPARLAQCHALGDIPFLKSRDLDEIEAQAQAIAASLQTITTFIEEARHVIDLRAEPLTIRAEDVA